MPLTPTVGTKATDASCGSCWPSTRWCSPLKSPGIAAGSASLRAAARFGGRPFAILG